MDLAAHLPESSPLPHRRGNGDSYWKYDMMFWITPYT